MRSDSRVVASPTPRRLAAREASAAQHQPLARERNGATSDRSLRMIAGVASGPGDPAASIVARYEALVRVSEALRTYHERDALFESLARELRLVVRFDLLGLALYDERTGVVEPRVLEASGEVAPLPELTSGEQLTYWVLTHRRPLVIPAIEHETRFAQEMAYLRSLPTASVCCLPLMTPLRAVGMLIAASRTPYEYSDADVGFLSLVANQVALAIDDATTYTALQASLKLERARLESLDASDALLQAIAPVLDLREVFHRVSEIAQPLIPHDMALLMVVAPDRASVVVHAVSGGAIAPSTRVDLEPWMRPWVDTPWDARIVDLHADPTTRDGLTARAGMVTALRLAIRGSSDVEAILEFSSRTPDAYDAALTAVGRRIANHVALALSHQQLAEEAERTAEARERAAVLERRVSMLAAEVDALGGHRRMVGESKPWKQALKQATQVAATDTTVLLLGESGTGKEVVARFIHRASTRSQGPFVAINCAALPEQLLESELFGHERGAFTGAISPKPGQLELAAAGVLFLDEVSEMSLAAQAKFLRVLQEREFQRLGGTRVLKSNVRVIAATNRDLAAAIARGTFREDLYYRLNVFEIPLPPLRTRPDDILPLSQAFLRDIGHSFGRPPAGISSEARRQLVEYRWPGNVRQLRNALERAAILCEGGLITGEHLSLPAHSSPSPPAFAATESSSPAWRNDPAAASDLTALERSAIETALRDARFNKSKAARVLGLTRTQLYVRLRKHGLE